MRHPLQHSYEIGELLDLLNQTKSVEAPETS